MTFDTEYILTGYIYIIYIRDSILEKQGGLFSQNYLFALSWETQGIININDIGVPI